MLGQQLAGDRATARQNVKDTVRQARFGVDFRQFQRGKRCDFARFEDHCVARSQRWCGFPQRDLDRVVPCANTSDHAKRLTAGIDKGGVAQRDLLPFQRRDQPGVVLQHIGTGDDINRLGFAQRLTGVEGFQRGQLVIALAQNIDRATQDA